MSESQDPRIGQAIELLKQAIEMTENAVELLKQANEPDTNERE